MRLVEKNICTIVVHKKKKDTDFDYVPEKRFLWFRIIEHYRLYGFKKYTVSEVSEFRHSYIEDNTVYFKPHIDFTMADGSCYTKWFDDTNMLDDYVSHELKKTYVNSLYIK